MRRAIAAPPHQNPSTVWLTNDLSPVLFFRCMLFDWTGGPHVYDVVDVLRQDFESGAWHEFAIRQLRVGSGVDRDALEDAMEDWIYELSNSVGRSTDITKYSSGDGGVHGTCRGKKTVVQAPKPTEVVKGVVSEAAAGLYQGLLSPFATPERRDAIDDSRQTWFCSKFVALAYKAVGLIAANRRSSDFTPNIFGPEGDNFLDLQNGASLGPLKLVSFELHVAAPHAVPDLGNLLSLARHSVVTAAGAGEDPQGRAERKAAELIKHWYKVRNRRRDALLLAEQHRLSRQGPCLRGMIEKCFPHKEDLSVSRLRRISAKLDELRALSASKGTSKAGPISNDPEDFLLI